MLGSLPGARSLAVGEYYAQPRNQFWTIMGALYGATPALPYAERLARLAAHGVALWDVCAEATRPGSLDAAIDRSSVRVNDFSAFLAAHRGIGRIVLNGRTAEELYRRRVLPSLGAAERALPRIVAPSTSPAHAALDARAKEHAWRAALGL